MLLIDWRPATICLDTLQEEHGAEGTSGPHQLLATSVQDASCFAWHASPPMPLPTELRYFGVYGKDGVLESFCTRSRIRKVRSEAILAADFAVSASALGHTRARNHNFSSHHSVPQRTARVRARSREERWRHPTSRRRCPVRTRFPRRRHTPHALQRRWEGLLRRLGDVPPRRSSGYLCAAGHRCNGEVLSMTGIPLRSRDRGNGEGIGVSPGMGRNPKAERLQEAVPFKQLARCLGHEQDPTYNTGSVFSVATSRYLVIQQHSLHNGSQYIANASLLPPRAGCPEGHV